MDSINKENAILKFSDANFLHREVIAIEEEWNCCTQEMINTYKGLPKRQIKQALAAQQDKLIENYLKRQTGTGLSRVALRNFPSKSPSLTQYQPNPNTPTRVSDTS